MPFIDEIDDATTDAMNALDKLNIETFNKLPLTVTCRDGRHIVIKEIPINVAIALIADHGGLDGIEFF